MPTVERPKRIHLLGQGARFEEAIAAEAITPGAYLRQDNLAKYQNHDVEGFKGERLFALEDALQGKTIEDAYAAADLVFAIVAMPGDVIFARLAVGEDIAEGDKLTSNGDGSLKKVVTTDEHVAQALEAVNLSDSESEDGRIRVRIL